MPQQLRFRERFCLSRLLWVCSQVRVGARRPEGGRRAEAGYAAREDARAGHRDYAAICQNRATTTGAPAAAERPGGPLGRLGDGEGGAAGED